MKKIVALLLALMMVFGIVACGSNTGNSDTNEANPSSNTAAPGESNPEAPSESNAPSNIVEAGSSLTIGLSTNALANIHNRHMFEGVKEIAEAKGHTVITSNADGSPSQQASDIENLVNAGCDIIVIQNGDNFTLEKPVKEALAAGVKIISHDSGWIDGIDCMFLLNNFAVKSYVCMRLAAEVGFGGKVITTSHDDNYAQRCAGYLHQDFLDEYDFEEVAHVQTTFPGTTEVTYNGVDAALTANPDVVAIFSGQDLEALGCIQALKEHGLYPQVKCIGVDGELEVLRDIKDGGSILCTAVANLDLANEQVVEYCERICAGDTTVPKYVDIPFDIVDISNVDEFITKAEVDQTKYAQ